ncbi:uncharacterized protein [Onthophagus taurus]|uniref:uncharacterized protein n=1 Tax=Onthophagus taurus TaxID=166361 RepID=UPI000C20CB16|nr:glycine N-acyltransferase-like protein 2 [Onthophagus taurus]XP_022920708.1 glycine N-acyltransferase-like protein 2 [Onthophagus taurus]
MEVLSDGKNFKIVHEEELPELLDELEKYLPDSIKFHQTLKTYLNDRVWDFHFYVPKNWPEEKVVLHFPGMTQTPNGKLYESFGVFCPCDSLDDLELLFNEDVLIDWTQPIYLNFTHGKIMDRIQEFYEDKGSMESLLGDFYVLAEKPEEYNNQIGNFAEDAEMLQLTKEHAQTIHELYPANNMESVVVFEKLIDQLPCYGIFSVSGDLAAWMVQSYYGAMFSMQTKPEYRRKGYGIHLAKYLTSVVAQRGYLPFVVIRPENDASKGLYTKLGFKKNYQTVRAILRPHEMNSDSQGGGTQIEQNGDE